MPTKIRPDETIDVDDQTVKRYGLPERGETVFWIETGEDSYSVKWKVSDEFGARDQIDVLRHLDYDIRAESITVQPRGEEDDLRHLGAVNSYLSGCNYLRVELDGFDIEWFAGDYTNRTVYSSTFDREDSLEDFHNILEYFLSGTSRTSEYSKAVQQVEQVVEDNEFNHWEF